MSSSDPDLREIEQAIVQQRDVARNERFLKRLLPLIETPGRMHFLASTPIAGYVDRHVRCDLYLVAGPAGQSAGGRKAVAAGAANAIRLRMAHRCNCGLSHTPQSLWLPLPPTSVTSSSRVTCPMSTDCSRAGQAVLFRRLK